MIQELLGGSKQSVATVFEGAPCSAPSPTLSSSTLSTPTSSSTPENLRCPRCDSSNTKFCYYNNYNLTQPRHFCKTCRRYWTKGGALRNVPIGGGCRKNKNTSITTSIAKLKTVTSMSDIGKTSFINGLEYELSSNPILWSSPQNSHLLSLLRDNRNPNPNPISNSISVKDEGFLLGTQKRSGSMVANGELDMGYHSSYLRNYEQQAQPNPQQHHQTGFALGETGNTALQELYERLRSSTNYYPGQATVLLGNVASSSTLSTSTILDSAPVTGGQVNLWVNNPLSWSDLPATSGALP